MAAAEQRLLGIQTAITTFRNKELMIDPSRSSAKAMDLVARLSGDIATTRAKRAEILATAPESTSLAFLGNRIEALQAQVDAERAKVVGSDAAIAPRRVRRRRRQAGGGGPQSVGRRPFGAQHLAERLPRAHQHRADGARRRKRRRLLLYVPTFEPKNALIVEQPDVVDPTGGRLVAVTSTTMDDLLAECPQVDLIKIDAEGSEERIYAGMQAVVERHRPTIVLEFNAARYADPGAFLERMGHAYGSLFHIDFEGAASPVGRRDLLETRHGQDWLLVLSHRPLA